jgi:low affinity Fe/Cu permease
MGTKNKFFECSKVSKIFNNFAKKISQIVGNAWSFMTAMFIIIIWLFTGPILGFSDTWQLIINTGTTIITFLIVFLIQNTQNRDVEIIQIKLDELIQATKGAKNNLINLDELTDEELKEIERHYKEIISKKSD